MTPLSRNNMGINLVAATAKLNTPNPNPNPSKQNEKEKECANCGGHASPFLHQVRHLGLGSNPRRLCTSCVLRLHPTSFCPVCFAFYGASPPNPSNRIVCSNCSSFTHSRCAGDTFLSSYLCPPCNCKDSSFSFFPLKDNKIDQKVAVALLCAAKIAASSMGKASTVAWAEADRKVREAALARKRAREALDNLLHLTIREKAKAKNKENDNDNANLNFPKVEDMDYADEDDGDIDVDLVRHIEDSLVKDEVIDS